MSKIVKGTAYGQIDGMTMSDSLGSALAAGFLSVTERTFSDHISGLVLCKRLINDIPIFTGSINFASIWKFTISCETEASDCLIIQVLNSRAYQMGP